MILAAHQPNLCPWLPYFDKLNKADVFVILINCQFEKNSYLNRCRALEKWWTIPVHKGNVPIKDKFYANGSSLVQTNLFWIFSMCMTLGIPYSKIAVDSPTEAKGTERIIELCRSYKCDKYLTNPDATEKYLDEKALNEAGITLLPHSFPHKVHTFEAFAKWGIEGTVKLLRKEKERFLCEI